MYPGCTSIFYSKSLCQGSTIVYSPLSPELIPMPGTRYYILDEYTNCTSQQNLKDSANGVPCWLAKRKEHCKDLNYTWDDEHRICYRYDDERQLIQDGKKKCRSEDSNSRFFLVDSEQTFQILLGILVAHGSRPVYLQGTRSGNLFLDDFGREITYFNWEPGEPVSDTYIRTVFGTNLQRTSSGVRKQRFICQVFYTD
ncbi:uncharacterized protein LOC111118180 isoform X2 [Crassostrea virginica]